MSSQSVDVDREQHLPDALAGSVERRYTSTVCGYASTHEVDPLQTVTRGTCANCGDWTVQTASDDALVAAARDAGLDALVPQSDDGARPDGAPESSVRE
jgi:hypothetical protein